MEKKCVICGKPIETTLMCQDCLDKIMRKDKIKVSDVLRKSIRKLFERRKQK